MGRPIIKLGDYYLEWSTVVDAPVTFGMNLAEFREYYQAEYGRQGMMGFDRRIERANTKGTSNYNDTSVDDTIAGNRAGPGESQLTREEIYRAYCLQEPIRNGWLPE